MCGISGAFTFERPTAANRAKLVYFLEQAMYVGSVRGRDGTGIFAVRRDNNQNVHFAKRAVDGSVFGDTYASHNILVDAEEYMATVVHNRKGTMGGNTDNAAHPFKIGKITLVHNGTLHTHKALGGGNNLASDSAAIAYALSRTDDPKTVLEELTGAFTLVWYDSDAEKLHIARNEQRPLSVAFHKHSDMMLFCSEEGMLTWLAGRDNINIPLGDVFTPEIEMLYTWDISKFGAKVKSYTQSPFIGQIDWDDGYGGWEGVQYSTPARAAASTHVSRGYDRPAINVSSGSTTEAKSPTGNQEEVTSERKKREKSLEKFSIEINDTIDFVAYDVSEPNPVSGMVRVEGLDVNGCFEVSAYIHWSVENSIMYQDLEGALVSATAHTVVKTPEYETWPIVSVLDLRIKEKNFWKEGKDYTKADKEVGTAAVIELPAPSEGTEDADKSEYVPPSRFCGCNASSIVKCSRICRDCEEAESVATCVDEEGGYVCQDGDDLIAENPLVPCGYGRRQTLDTWSTMTKHGCSACSCDLIDPMDTYWTRNDEPICDECMEDFNTIGVYNHQVQH